MGSGSYPRKPNAFMSWRDLVLTPAIEIVLSAITTACTWPLTSYVKLGALELIVVWYFVLVFWTLVFLKLLRTLLPLKPGCYSFDRYPMVCYRYCLTGFLHNTNLYFLYYSPIIPPPFRKYFYQMLGAKFGPGIISIGGRIADPPELVSVGENVIIGDGVLICPHLLIRHEGVHMLILGKIEIADGALIGASSMIMPGVTVGENAMVRAQSLIPMNTSIPADQTWEGEPLSNHERLAKTKIFVDESSLSVPH